MSKVDVDVEQLKPIEDEDRIEITPNRAMRRAMRRGMHREHRKNTRFWRSTFRGIHAMRDIVKFVPKEESE